MTDSPRARVWDEVIRTFIPSDRPACQGIQEATAAAYDEPSAGLIQQRVSCVGCPVFIACARHAIDHEPWGLWGLTEEQRWNLGGVVPKDWADHVPDPQIALDELHEQGVPFDAVVAVVEAAALKDDFLLDAVVTWEPFECAAEGVASAA